MEYDLLEILKTDSYRSTADYAAELVKGNSELFDYLVEIALAEKEPVNWRAVRVIYLCALKNRELFVPYVNRFAYVYTQYKNEGMKRGIMQILSNFTNNLNEQNIDLMIEICFKNLLTKQNVSLKLYTIKTLYNISEKYPDLKQQLLEAIEFNIINGDFRSVGTIHQIIGKLYSELRN